MGANKVEVIKAEAIKAEVIKAPGLARFREMPTTSDIFMSRCSVLVNPVNCLGTSGALAGAFSRRWPDMDDVYQFWCEMGWLDIGRPMIWRNPRAAEPSVLLFPTMVRPGSAAHMADIMEGLEYLAGVLRLPTPRRGQRRHEALGITSLAVPALGCGVGGLEWGEVRDVIVETLGPCDLSVELYPPHPSYASGRAAPDGPARSGGPGVFSAPDAGEGGEDDDGEESEGEPGREGGEDDAEDETGVLDFG